MNNSTFNLASQNYQNNKLDVAENLCNKILKNNPNHFDSIFLLGVIATQKKKFLHSKKIAKKSKSN